MSGETRDRLDALIAAVRAQAPAAGAVQPAPEPRERQSFDEWLAEVADARARADARALQHRARLDALSRELFGHSSGDLLGASKVELTRDTLMLEVPAEATLDGMPVIARGAIVDAATNAPHKLRVVVTTPRTPTAAIIRLHGGAFWMGGGDAGDQIDKLLIDTLAAELNAAVLNVDYRLAPEHPFPAAICDTLHVLDALRNGATGLDVDPSAIAVVGTSSGANVAAAATLADVLGGGAPPLAALALLVPSVLVSEVPDELRNDEEAWVVRQSQLRGYLGDDIAADNPWVSLATAPIPAGMPATFAAIAAHDEIATGGVALCEAILASGGAATAVEYEMTHTIAPPEIETAMLRDLVSFLAAQLT